MTYLPLIFFTVLSNAAAQLMLKQGMLSLGALTTDGPLTVLSILTLLFKVVFNPWVFIGLCTFVISMMSHLYVLSKLELSFVYPFLSLAFIAVAVGSWFFFSEDMNSSRLLGIAFICVGTFFVARGGEVGSEPVEASRVSTQPAANALSGGQNS